MKSAEARIKKVKVSNEIKTSFFHAQKVMLLNQRKTNFLNETKKKRYKINKYFQR